MNVKGNTALHVACGSLDAGLIECLLANTECDLRLKNVQDETPLDQLFLGYLRDTRRPSEELVRRLVRAGALFSMPWNFALTSANAPCLILFLAILCKLETPSLSSLFLNDKPFFTDLIVRGYWPNALLVALRLSIIEPHFKVFIFSYIFEIQLTPISCPKNLDTWYIIKYTWNYK